MNQTGRPSDGGKSLLWLTALILGGLLFGAGVMVGRGMAPPGPQARPDALAQIDQRDSGSAHDDDRLTFPQALSGPPVRPVTPVEPDAGNGGLDHCLQVASFKELSQAEQLVDRLKTRGLGEVRIVSGEVPGKGQYFRVRVGRFASRQSAEQFKSENDLDGLVIQADER